MTRGEKRNTLLWYAVIMAVILAISVYSISYSIGERTYTTGMITSLYSEADEGSARFYLIVKLDSENKIVKLRTSRKPYYKIGVKVKVKVRHSNLFSHKRYAYAGMAE